MKTIRLLIFLFVILQIFTCTKPYTIDFKNINKRIVVNSLFLPDSVMKFYLTEEASLADDVQPDKYKQIENAQIIIFANDDIIDTASYAGKGKYYADFKPEENIFYRIKINAEGYDEIYAEDKIPESVKIDSLYSLKNDDEYYQYQVKIIFDDPAGEENYYLFSIYWPVEYEGDYWLQEASYRTNDPAIGEWLNNSFQVPVFKDDLFNGQRYELSFELHVDELEGHFEQGNCYFLLFSISKSMYLYMKSYNEQTPAFGDDPLGDFQRGLMEPIPVYTNVEGGLGIFAGYSISTDSLYFE